MCSNTGNHSKEEQQGTIGFAYYSTFLLSKYKL